MGQKPSADIYELNPDHTHFIMVEDEGKDAQFASMRFAIEKQLQLKYGRHKRIRLMSIGKYIDMLNILESDNIILSNMFSYGHCSIWFKRTYSVSVETVRIYLRTCENHNFSQKLLSHM